MQRCAQRDLQQASTGAIVNVFPIQTPPEGDGAKCPNCGARIAADQRYCLACGQPCSPVRLPFLDVLQAESELRRPDRDRPADRRLPAAAALGRRRGRLVAPLLRPVRSDRRAAHAGLIGLLVGHWLAPIQSVGPIDRQDRGQPCLRAATSAPTTSTPTSTTPTSPTKAATEQKRARHRSAGSQRSEGSRNGQGKAEGREQTQRRHASRNSAAPRAKRTSRKSKS